MIARSLGTHDGAFHADEVTASALLIYYHLVDREKLIRSRDKEKLALCEFVCDVGGEYAPESKKFDHHQISYQGKLSSAGMVWAYLRDQGIVDPQVYTALNRGLILGVDAHDNGIVCAQAGVCTFSHIISNFVPVKYDAGPEEMDRAFFAALDFVLQHLTRFFEKLHYSHQCKELLVAKMSEYKDILIFEESMPWMDLFFELGGESHPAEFIIMPSGNSWKLRGIPPNNEDRMNVRRPLPQEWAGLLEEELQRVSGIPGAIFCHKGRFISVWKTKEDALHAARKISLKKGG